MGAIALAIKLDSRGPVLFRQIRVGRGNDEFVLLKFRTMVVGADAMYDDLFVHSRDPDWLHLDADPRVTRLGRFLRRSSTDEIPQLWNVLRGEMSLVGPRPLVPAEHARLPMWARSRSEVSPGITGLWQISGRTSLTFQEMLVLDDCYARSSTFRTDLKILIRTLPVVLFQTGAN